MKAAFVEQFGGPEVLRYGDLPDPVAGPGQIVVDVAAASINGADWKVRAGQYSEVKFPLVLGRDFSGSVATLGTNVHDLKIGDAVFGVLEAGREGAYVEKIAITAAIVAKKPGGLSHVEAAASALTGLTALAAVETTLKLQPGETILIQGGAGGVAGFAIQLAKHIGARVITTTSKANMSNFDRITSYFFRQRSQKLRRRQAYRSFLVSIVRHTAVLIPARPDRHVAGPSEAQRRAVEGAAAPACFALRSQPPLEMSDAASKRGRPASPASFRRQTRRMLRSSFTGAGFALIADAGNCSTVAIWPGHNRVTSTICPLGN